MGKLVVLKLSGDLESQGFKVTLEVGDEGKSPDIKTEGDLPANPTLATQLNSLWSNYRELGKAFRIKSKRIKYSGSFSERIEEVKDSTAQLRERFTAWLDSEQFRPLDKRLREELNRDQRVRVLISTEDRNLQKLPWHFWDFIDRYPNAEVALSPVQYKKPKSYKVEKKTVKILAILGGSEGLEIEDKRLLEQLPGAEIVFLVEPKHHDINDQLWEQAWDIIFFAGHSQTEEDQGRIYINSQESLTLDEVWYSLRKAVERGLQLVIFNSCDGLGLARKLDDLEIPQMIVMREMVPDKIAQEFLQAFLQGFATGKPLYVAFREAREKLQGWEKNYPCASWLPVICQNPSAVPPSWNDFTQTLGPEQIKRKEAFSLRISHGWQTLIHRKHPFRLAALFLLGVGVIEGRLGNPKLSTAVNEFGFKQYYNGNLYEAKKALEFALQLNPKNRDAIYNLAWMCENVQEFECARQKYQMAAELGKNSAFSQLGRMAILIDQDYEAAVDFLLLGLKLHKKEDLIKYALLKNLGWARFGQQRYQEALEYLDRAIKIDANRGASYCLKAQVLEGLKDLKGADQEWKSCLKLGDQNISEEERWMGIAKKRLEIFK